MRPLTASSLTISLRLKYFWQVNKKKILIGALIGISVFAAIVFITNLTFCVPESEGVESVSPLVNTALFFLQGICSPDIYTELADQVRVQVTGGTVVIGGMSIPNMGGAISGINTYLVGVGTVVAMVLWFPTLLSSLISGQVYAELVIKKFITLGVAIFLVANSLNISEQIVNAGADVTEKIAGYATGVAVESSAYDTISQNLFGEEETLEEPPEPTSQNPIVKMLNSIKDTLLYIPKLLFNWINKNLIKPISIIVVLLIPWVLIKISGGLCSVFTVARGVEMLILVMMSPIPFAIVGNEPLGSGTGARFIKNLFALSLQGAVMLIIGFVCQSILNGMLGTFSTYEDLVATGMWRVIAISFAEIALLMKSLTISQKVFGLS